MRAYPILESEPMLNEQDKVDIIGALSYFKRTNCQTNDCTIRCGELIKKVQAIATLDKRTADRLAGELDPLDVIRLPTRWKVGSTLKNKRHGWEGVIVAPLGRNGLINIDVGIGVKVGEHWSDWDLVCGPEGESFSSTKGF